MNDDDPIFRAWRDATNCYLAGLGLTPLKASGQAREPETASAYPLERTDASPPLAPIDLRGTELWERLRVPDTHDFRDRGDPMVKKYDPNDWHSWETWPDSKFYP